MELPIFGKGSQPEEEDGAALEYLPLPQAMTTYVMPTVSVAASAQALQAAKNVLYQLLYELENFVPEKTNQPIVLTGLDGENLQLVNELLGEGEVSVIYNGTQKLRIQESVLAGVWRLQRLNEDNQIAEEWLEIGSIPKIIRYAAFESSNPQIDTDWDALPPGVMNAPPLLAELNAQITGYCHGAEPYVINLSLLPQTEEDLAFLMQRLGPGKVTMLSRGYGNCRISSTGSQNVWWVQYFNSEDTLILNTLEVADVPVVACAAIEDLNDSRQRLQEMLSVYL